MYKEIKIKDYNLMEEMVWILDDDTIVAYDKEKHGDFIVQGYTFVEDKFTVQAYAIENWKKVESVERYYAKEGLDLLDFLHDYFTDNFNKEFKLNKEEMLVVAYRVSNFYEGYCGTPKMSKKSFEEYSKIYEENKEIFEKARTENERFGGEF